MIISSETLAAHLANPHWIVFDCRHDLKDFHRGAAAYAVGHIPGAFFARVEEDLSGPKTGRNGRHPLPDPDTFARFLADRGVDQNSRIIAYDDIGGQYAARLWWLARWIGLPNASVLDGGYPKWVAENRPISRDVPGRRAGSVTARPDAAMVVTTADVAGKLESPELVVVDARAPERFRGEMEPIDPVAGHIPGARNRFFKANLNPDLTLRSSTDLQAGFVSLLAGARPEQVAHQCGSGVTACVNLLAMEAAGLRGSKLYVGSWSEWIADPSRPTARGD
ncbi:MAG TPA: sulfurtransferase [Candidatus Didemnitutus sp.]|jgi:thiosulfate/3-mercaptopyruvate sulfurtransferase